MKVALLSLAILGLLQLLYTASTGACDSPNYTDQAIDPGVKACTGDILEDQTKECCWLKVKSDVTVENFKYSCFSVGKDTASFDKKIEEIKQKYSNLEYKCSSTSVIYSYILLALTIILL